MLQQSQPDDSVVATGDTHTIPEFLDETFGHLGLDWRQHVEQDPRFLCPAEVDILCGDASKARRELGWQPRVSFRDLCRMMIEADLELASQEANR